MAARKSDKKIFREGLELARKFYLMMGCKVEGGYRFDLASHPQEVGCWNMACVAYDHINGTDLQSAADEVGNER